MTFFCLSNYRRHETSQIIRNKVADVKIKKEEIFRKILARLDQLSLKNSLPLLFSLFSDFCFWGWNKSSVFFTEIKYLIFKKHKKPLFQNLNLKKKSLKRIVLPSSNLLTHYNTNETCFFFFLHKRKHTRTHTQSQK